MDPILPHVEDSSRHLYTPPERPKFLPNPLKNRTRIRLDSDDSTFCQKNADFYFSPPSYNTSSSLSQAQSIAAERGGECLSSYCEDDWQPLTYKCALSHIWETNEVLLNGSWCWQCESILSRAKQYANSLGGDCLNSFCTNKLAFQCSEGHQWEADAMRFSKRWCGICKANEKKRKKKEIEEGRETKRKREFKRRCLRRRKNE